MLFAHHTEAFLQIEVMGRNFPDGMTEHRAGLRADLSRPGLDDLRGVCRRARPETGGGRPRRPSHATRVSPDSVKDNDQEGVLMKVLARLPTLSFLDARHGTDGREPTRR